MVLINPEIEPLDDALEPGWEGCLSIPGLRGVVPRFARIGYRGLTPDGRRSSARRAVCMPGSSSTRSITWKASSFRCA